MELTELAAIQPVNQRLMKSFRSSSDRPSNLRTRAMEWEWLQK